MKLIQAAEVAGKRIGASHDGRDYVNGLKEILRRKDVATRSMSGEILTRENGKRELLAEIIESLTGDKA